MTFEQIAVVGAGTMGNGIAQVFLPVNHFDYQGLPGRYIESIYDAQEHSKSYNMPHLDGMGKI